MTARLLTAFLFSIPFGAVTACGQRSTMVYVLEEPQTVTLTASASALEVKQGETVVLHVARHTTGRWKQIPMNEVSSGQCWVYRPPVESEPEVADGVHWEIVPERAVSLNQDYRLDHTKIATMNRKGTITLTPISTVKCEPDRVVRGPTIQLEVS